MVGEGIFVALETSGELGTIVTVSGGGDPPGGTKVGVGGWLGFAICGGTAAALAVVGSAGWEKTSAGIPIGCAGIAGGAGGCAPGIGVPGAAGVVGLPNIALGSVGASELLAGC